jgi:hypothetical protein
MMNRLLTLTALLFFSFHVSAQYHVDVIKKLSSPEFHGRGYYKKGDVKAARYIASEFQKAGLQPAGKSFLQAFTFPVNTFPSKVEVKIGNKAMAPGKDFIVSPACPPTKGTYPLIRIQPPFPDFNARDYSNEFLLFDKSGLDSVSLKQMDSLMRALPDVKGAVFVTDKLTWSVSQSVGGKSVIRVMRDSFPADAQTITLDVRSKLIKDYKTYNVAGYVPGTTNPDSFIVFTAHYDHLGRMGKHALFAGANDNASGTAMIMDLARYYAKPENRPAKSVVFIAFAAEEAGLVGSKYYTENPLLPLNTIRFLINLDLMGNGDEGVMVVNGEVHEQEFLMLESINNVSGYVKTLGKRGKAANSDHYWFGEKGVPAFFLYTMGGSKAYHDIYDLPDTLPLTEFEDVQKLLRDFVRIVGR